MKLYSYVVARDYGFAPNPFGGFCTLATCKPEIRKHAQPGDWVVGVGSKSYGLGGKFVYAMRVDETLSYDEYWNDPRFRSKRPNLRGSLVQAFGDNIYHCDPHDGSWLQEPSHHSRANGTTNPANVKHDTRVSRVLVGRDFIYWGGTGHKIPLRFRGNIGVGGRPTRCNLPVGVVLDFVSWVGSFDERGYVARPKEFEKLLHRR